MNKNNAVIILVISVLMSFIAGTFGGIIILKSNNDTKSNSLIENKLKSVTLNEDDSISGGVKSIYDAVVVVEGFSQNKLVSTGTGFIYKENNGKAYIMTNHHVISGSETIKIIMSDNTVVAAEILGSEAYSDIAVLSIDASKAKDIAVIGDSTKLKVGDTLFTVGSPEGADYAGTVTKGILSGKDRLIAVALSNSSSSDYYMRVLQTDAAINPGNSGGPLCNINGEVIGVTNLKLVDSTVEGMGFAIPIEDAILYASTLEKGEELVRPYVGISMLDITDEYVLWNNGITIDETIKSGIAIVDVEKNSPAYQAKLEKGDVIISLGGEKIESIAEFRYQLYRHSPGETVAVEYVRGKKVKKTEIKLTGNKSK